MGSLYADVVPWRRRWTPEDRWIQDLRPNGEFLWWHVGHEERNDWNLWFIFEVLWPPWGGPMVPLVQHHMVLHFAVWWYGLYVG